MNAHQRTAGQFLRREFNELVGAYQNSLLDYSPGDDEYDEAIAFLNNREEVKQQVYDNAMYEAKRSHFAKHMKFAGREWMMNLIEKWMEEDMEEVYK